MHGMTEFRGGVGLAAPQVGVVQRIAVIETTGGEKEPLVLINPDIYFFSDEKEENEEGCLSIPDINLKVTRPARVSVRAFDEHGREFTIENAEGLLARAIQHETDHLDGIMFVDRASVIARKMIDKKLKRLAKSGGE